MSQTLNLHVINNSEIDLTFAMFANLPSKSNYQTLSLAWLVQQIDNNGNEYTFTWTLDWAFTWSAAGAAAGYTWGAKGRPVPADPNAAESCAVGFDYDGDFKFTPTVGTPDGETLLITDSPKVPVPSVKPNSVGIALNGSPVCATQAGPNLQQAYTLHPTYYIDAGQYTPGYMVDVAETTQFQQIEFQNGATTMTATLNQDNTWSVGS